jgi:hypothetical protein
VVQFNNDGNTPVPLWETLYDEIEPYLKTGDVILQHGLYASSIQIEMIEDSMWSHISMVVRPADIGIDHQKNAPCCWESNDILTEPDIITGKPKMGPTLVDLRARLTSNEANTYDYGILLRQLEVDRSGSMMDALKAFIPTVHDEKFPDMQTATANFFNGRSCNTPSSPGVQYCSQLIANTFMAMGLLTKQFVGNAYSPRDFTSNGQMQLLGRAHFINEMRLGMKPQAIPKPCSDPNGS